MEQQDIDMSESEKEKEEKRAEDEKRAKKEELVQKFKDLKYQMIKEGDALFEHVRKHNEGVKQANNLHFEYTRLLSRDERPIIFELKQYTLSKNNPSKRFKK